MAKALRQQLALETLQIWSPLSYQLQLATYLPELEIYSYVHLFPNAFSSFLTWYSYFRPLARHVIYQFRDILVKELKQDPWLKQCCHNIIIQSRLKTATSAFKKMLRNAKQKDQLHDIVGIRIILDCNDPTMLLKVFQAEQQQQKQKQSLHTKSSSSIKDQKKKNVSKHISKGSKYSKTKLKEKNELKKKDEIMSLELVDMTSQETVDTSSKSTMKDISSVTEEQMMIDLLSSMTTSQLEILVIDRVHQIIQQKLCHAADIETLSVSKEEASTSIPPPLSSSNSHTNPKWQEDISRFKDYVRSPKPSG
jgi:hypothetical protein